MTPQTVSRYQIRREQLIAAGLCIRCRHPHTGRGECAECKAKLRPARAWAMDRKRHTLRYLMITLSLGLCVVCERRHHRPGKLRCKSCAGR